MNLLLLILIFIYIIAAILSIIVIIKMSNHKKEQLQNVECRKGRSRCFGKYPNWKIYNKKEFKTIVDELIKANKHPFLCGGNLLGYGRQKDLLDNDDDLNIALFDDEYDETVNQIIKKLGYSLKIYKTKKGIQLTINKGTRRNDTDVEIDIGIWFRRHNNYYFFTRFSGQGEQYKITPFDLILTNVWDDLYIYLPSNYEQVLYDNYGNWKTPNPNFKYPDESPGYLKNDMVQPKSNMIFPNIIN